MRKGCLNKYMIGDDDGGAPDQASEQYTKTSYHFIQTLKSDLHDEKNYLR